ncbi:TPA: DUF551 domain-containing protein [Enterobacter cloacae]|nr:DUF551 domain-containing protein [Enterobacter cloacae]
MSTITRELAKLFRKITNSEIDAEGNAHVVLSPADSLLINNARISLASLEAEAVCVIDQSNLDYLKSGFDADVWPASRAEMGDVLLYRAAPPAPVSVPDDYFSSLVAAARVRADKAMRKFPQPNYVLNKVAEESGEVIKAVIHFTEGREEWRNVEGEIIDNLAMLIRLVMEGDQVIGFTPPDACRAAMLQSFGNSEQLNSPVIPDGWVACSELMPEQFKAILAFNEYGEVWSGAYDRYWNFYCDNLLVEHVTHWMPLPAAPQQEA